MSDPRTKPTVTLVTDVFAQASTLLQGEVALARAEIGDNIRKAVGGLICLATAAVLAGVALNLVVGALVALLIANGVAPAGAAFAVGAVVFGIALVLVQLGLSALKGTSLAPTRTVRRAKRDAETLMETLKHDTSH